MKKSKFRPPSWKCKFWLFYYPIVSRCTYRIGIRRQAANSIESVTFGLENLECTIVTRVGDKTHSPMENLNSVDCFFEKISPEIEWLTVGRRVAARWSSAIFLSCPTNWGKLHTKKRTEIFNEIQRFRMKNTKFLGGSKDFGEQFRLRWKKRRQFSGWNFKIAAQAKKDDPWALSPSPYHSTLEFGNWNYGLVTSVSRDY